MRLFDFFKKTIQQESRTEENCIKSNEKRDSLDEMDATQDAAVIWEMMKKAECEKTEHEARMFKKEAYEKLIFSKDSYTCDLLGYNTFSYLDEYTKTNLILEIAQARLSQVQHKSIASLELAKMVTKQGKILDYDSYRLLLNLLKEKKLYRNEFFEPEWINNPRIWEQTDYKNREYLIKLKIFLDAESSHNYVNYDGQTLYEVVGEDDSLSLWEALINKYDNVNELKAFLNDFRDD